MTSVRVNMRLPEGLWQRAEDYAKARGSNRTAVVQAALEAFLVDAEGGVPDLPAAVASAAEQAERAVTPQSSPRRPVVPRPPVPPIEGVSGGRRVREAAPADYVLPKIAARRVR